MALISSIRKSHFHVRSISLPSTSNQVPEFNYYKVITSLPSIGQKLNGLKDLYDYVDKLLLLPTSQRALAQECQKDLVSELLDELLRLKDISSTAKDALLMTSDSAQQLQSALRRKRGDGTALTCAVEEYQSRRKMVKKAILKVLRDVKCSGNPDSSSAKRIQETAAIVTLREVESVTFRVFESLLCFILGSMSQTNSRKWPLISKMMGPKRVVWNESSERRQVEKLDTELAKKSTGFQIENVQKELAQLDLILQDILEELECIFRHLIKTRVSLLNAVNC